MKWTTALAVAGAAVIGAGAGYGADILARPSAEKTITATTTATTTVVPQPVSISYKPPLSAQAQTTVNSIFSQLAANHAGETEVYATHAGGMGENQLFKVVLKGGKVVAIRPEDMVNPTIAREDAYISANDAMTLKIRNVPSQQNYASAQLVNAPTRILYPMKRVGARADPFGQFVRITWDEALNTIASTIQQSVKTYGPLSVTIGGACGGSDSLFNTAGFGVDGGYSCISNGNHNFAADFCYGAVDSTSYITDLFNSKLIVFWGHDPTTGSGDRRGGGLFLYSLAKEKGIPIISIDSKHTMAAEAFSSQWIPIRAGTDVAMMLAVANVLFKQNLYNQDYVSKFVEPTGFQKWKDYVLGNTAGPDGKIDRTPEWAEQICGVPAQTIKEFAALFANSKPTRLDFNWGPARQSRGMNPARAAIYLQSMMGYVGVQGGHPVIRYSVPLGIPAPAIDYGTPAPKYTAPKLFAEFKLYDAILLKKQLDAGKITKDQYCTTVGANSSWPVPDIHVIFVMGSHSPVNQKQNIQKQIQALKQIDLFVKADRHWIDAQFADIVLPLTQFYEMTEFQTIPDGFVYIPKLVDPPGEARPDEWIRTQLAAKLGVASSYDPKMASVTYDQWETTVQGLAKTAYETWAGSATAKTLLGTTPPSWDDFVKKPVLRVPSQTLTPAVAFQAQIQQGTKFPTTSGKIEFYNSYFENFDLTKPFVKGDGAAQGAPIAPMAIWENPEEMNFDPGVAKYPLLMTTTHNRYRGHTLGESNPLLRNELYRHSVWISAVDAKARNITDGDMTTIFNDRGVMMLPAYVTSRMTPGHVHIYDGGWYKPTKSGIDIGGDTNLLINDSLTAAAAGQDSSIALVDVAKVGGS